MQYKFFTTKYTTLPNDLVKLREDFGKLHFKEGSYDGKQGIFCLSSLEKIENSYDKPIKSSQFLDTLFFPPKELITDKQKFLDEGLTSKNKIKVICQTGINIYIYPATEEPRKVIFNLFDSASEINTPTTKYAKLAYELFPEIESGTIFANDKRIAELISLGLIKTYNYPLDLINWLDVFSVADVEKLLFATLGVDSSLLKKAD